MTTAFDHISPGMAGNDKNLSACPFSQAAKEFDPFSDGFQQDPPGYVAWSREDMPVFFSPKLGYWVVTRYEDIKHVFRDNHTFSSSIALDKVTPTSQEAMDVLASFDFKMGRTLVNEDEPEHMARRRVLLEPFAPERLSRREPMIRQLVGDYVDRIIDNGRADLVEQMFWEVPLTVALEFLGVPDEDRPMLRQYSVAHTVNTWGRPSAEDQVGVASAVGHFWQYAGQVLEKMRLDPDREGWMQYAIRKQKELPEVVTDSYLHSMMMAGIVAGHETTTFGLTNAVKLLLENRSAWEQICADPSLIPNAVEECLRHNGSVTAWHRITTKDTAIGGVAIPEGSRILVVSSSGNHDPRRFEDPELVDLRRDDAMDHLTFGYGAHQCIGKNLARMQMQIFLEELTRRIPHLYLSEQDFTYVPNTSLRGPEHLWVEWDPTKNPERRDPSVRQSRGEVNIGEPTEAHKSRYMRVDKVVDSAAGVRYLTLSSADGTPLPAFTPGAHLDVECGDTGIVRQYSLSGPEVAEPVQAPGCPVAHTPRPTTYEIAVLCEPESRGGSRWIHKEVTEGDILTVRGPRNHFRLPQEPKRLIFVAGGIGITPIRSMASWAARQGIPYELHYLGRDRKSMAFLEDLTATHGGNLHVHCSSEGARANLPALMSLWHEDGVTGRAHVYACGPQRMLDDITAGSKGWPEGTVAFEHFTSQLTELDPEREHEFTVVMENSAREVIVPRDRTVIQALREAGFEIPANCHEGLCGTCEVPVLDGEIDHRDVVLSAAERRTGDRMMSCCSRASGNRIVLGL